MKEQQKNIENLKQKAGHFFQGLFTFRKKRLLAVLPLEAALVLAALYLPKELSGDFGQLWNFFLLDAGLLLGLLVKIRIGEKWKGYLTFLLFMTAPALCFWEIEYINRGTILDKSFIVAALNYLIILLVFVLIFFVLNHAAASLTLGMGLFTFFGLLDSFVYEFRGNSIRAADVYALRTAMNVAEGYEIVFTEERLLVMLTALGFSLLGFYLAYRSQKRTRIFSGAIFLAAAMPVCGIFEDEDFVTEYQLKPYLWELETSRKDHGAFLDFAAGLPYLTVEKPDGYSREETEQIEQKGADQESGGLLVEQKETPEKNPHVIVIMNESFADFRKLGALETNQPVLENWDSMEENVIKGSVSVPIFGGWTSNSEFEFLTGFSNAFFPSGSIAYQNYVKEGTPSVNDQMKALGYRSAFLHPMSATGWNRKAVYEYFGFDQTYYAEAFEGEELLRDKISDRGDYRKLTEVFEENKEDPLFLFNVTIQNHGGYLGSDLEDPIQIISPSGSYPQAEEYLTLVRESDRAWKELTQYFEQEEDPVVLCMFGDHYPKVEETLYEELAKTSGKSGAEAESLKYQVPFMIYTNFDIEEKEYENISLNYLAALVCETAGLPLTEYQKYLESLYEEFPVVNVYGVKDSAGNWYNWDQALEFPKIREYEKVQYKNLFDS